MSETETTKSTKPSDYLTITVNKEPVELFMSGGLVRRLAPYVGALEQFSLIYSDVFIQTDLIVEALRPKSKRGEDIGRYTIDDFDISQEDTNKLVSWIVEHVLHFFADSVASAQILAENSKGVVETLQRLVQSQTGSSASPETKPSVGPSTQS